MITRWNPFREFDTIFDRIYGLFTNIKEEKDKSIVEIELPGVDLKDINISVEEGMLKISVENKVFNNSHWGFDNLSTEYSRSFIIPEETDIDKIEAILDKGILYISIPKPKEKKAKRIEVKVKSSS